jgi:hypothetical protein
MRAAFLLGLLLTPLAARAQDAGAPDAGDCASLDCLPVACDGGLCETDNGSACGLVAHGGGGGGGGAAAVLLAAALLMLAAARRKALPAAVAVLLASAAARAETPAAGEAVDVKLPVEAPARRYFSLELNPLPLITISKASLNVSFAPAEHHAITFSPFYSWAQTEPIALLDAQGNPTVRLPHQSFTGFGAELGYRYFLGRGGLRGFFAGPSLILGHFTAAAENGDQVPFWDVGFAADAGWQTLIADRLVVSLGAGVQVLLQDRSIPAQSFPARIYANGGVLPRLLLAVGWAL